MARAIQARRMGSPFPKGAYGTAARLFAIMGADRIDQALFNGPLATHVPLNGGSTSSQFRATWAAINLAPEHNSVIVLSGHLVSPWHSCHTPKARTSRARHGDVVVGVSGERGEQPCVGPRGNLAPCRWYRRRCRQVRNGPAGQCRRERRHRQPCDDEKTWRSRCRRRKTWWRFGSCVPPGSVGTKESTSCAKTRAMLT